jgi:alkylation response protein AidB-like acyl-CoA dehydrogenase
MKPCLTSPQQEILHLAGRLADRFAERAAAHDRDGSFPFDNYEDLRKSGYLTLTVPEELGGGGASLLDLIIAQERLAMGCGSTALSVNMHVSPIGQWSSVWRETRDEELEYLLRGVVAGDVIWASLTSEQGIPNMLMDSTTIAQKIDGGYRVNGRKIFCTNTDIATNFSFTARYEDQESGPRLLLFRVAKDTPGFEFVRTWDTLGMRATQSNDLKIEDAFVPETALVHWLPVDHYDPRILRTVFAWAMPTFGAVYLGIAGGAMAWAKQTILERGRQDDPLVQASFAEMEVLLETARAVLWRHAAEVTSGQLFKQVSVQEGQARAALAKIVPCNNAVAIMSHVVDVAGGLAFMRRFPLERMLRDVQAGPIMPYNTHQATKLLGATSLGVELFPTVADDRAE